MDLSTLLRKKDVILLDGVMGTQLADRGLSMGGASTPGRAWSPGVAALRLSTFMQL
jgi:S-methylmethionine-dependent homocysteine/selenocysteine methylase